MMRHHAEPQRVRERRCVECGIPSDPDAAEVLRDQAEAMERDVGTQAWDFCGTCSSATCGLLRRLCAIQAEREG